MTDWQDEKYHQVLEETLAHVAQRRRADPTFTRTSLERLLQTQYVNYDNDWVGRGSVQDIVCAATIAAYEHALVEWRKESASDTQR